VAEFTSCLLKRGKRSTAEHLLYRALDLLEKKSGQKGVEVFHKAMGNVKPALEVKSRRVGGANYQVPVEVRSERRTALAIRWLIENASGRNDKSMSDKLAAEFLAASNNEGGAVKKKEDTHKMAEANKAFAHFRW
jgi:small subunit ribosomal protein S7